MSVDVRFEGARHDADGVPVYEVGEELRGTFTLVADHDTHARGVQLQVACFIHGSGTAETVALVPEHMAYQGDLPADQPVQGSFRAVIPSDGPLSYAGRRIKCDWEVRLRVDIPIWRDPRYSFPFRVVPRQAPAESDEE